MTDYETPRLQTVARKPAIGVDDTGAMHRFDTVERTIYVVTEGKIEHIEPLEGRQLSAWVDYVNTERGWRDLRYTDESFAAQLATVLGDMR